MAEILGAATTATKFFLEVNQISIDNWTFKLFYKATTTLLLVLSIVSSSKQFFGEPITCDVRNGAVNQASLNSYCWMYSTFDIPPDFKGSCSKRIPDGTTLYNTYYQWVSLYLVLQAICFYIPRSIWLTLEGGLMKFLAKGARGKIIEDACDKRENLLKTFQEHLHNKYNGYAAGYFLCEMANLLVVISLFFSTNRFLNYSFLSYGPLVYQYYSMPVEERIMEGLNPLCETFPRVASCDYVRFGSGGSQEVKNAICILSLNMINDKIFLILWYWYVVLVLAGLFRLLWRALQISSSRVRYLVMRFKMHRYFKQNDNVRHIRHYIFHCSIGDWFVLYQMSKNMNRRFFADFITVLSKRVNPHPNVVCEEDNELYDEQTRKALQNGQPIPEAPACDNESFGKYLDINYIGDEDKDDKEEDKKDIPGPTDFVGL